MPEEKKEITMPHSLIMKERSTLTVSGVNDVDSFDESTIVIFTSQGEMTVKGSALKLNKLSVEVGDLIVDGKIDSIVYADNKPAKNEGFFTRVLR